MGRIIVAQRSRTYKDAGFGELEHFFHPKADIHRRIYREMAWILLESPR